MTSIRMLARGIVVSAAMVLGVLPDANAQALAPIGVLRSGYNAVKAKTKPEGDLKAQIDAIDRELAEATRLGRNSELRRLFARGFALLTGRPWTPQADYAVSLVLRTDRVVADSLTPFVARLEQLYLPAIELTRSLDARVTLRKAPTAVPGAPGPLPEIVKDFGAMEGVSRDLRESPFAVEIDVSNVPNGQYLLAVEVIDQDAPLGVATLPISLHKGLDAAASRLSGLSLPAAVKPDVLFPFDRIRNVNRGRLPLGAFDIASEIASAEKIAEAASGGKDPYTGRTGDMERHYLLEAAGEIMPYRLGPGDSGPPMPQRVGPHRAASGRLYRAEGADGPQHASWAHANRKISASPKEATARFYRSGGSLPSAREITRRLRSTSCTSARCRKDTGRCGRP